MPAKKNSSPEISLTRIYDAPVQKVWDAWVDEKQVAQWWGPRGFTLTSHSKKDVRPGGTWKYTMHGPDGTNYENKAVFLEVKEHALLVYDHGAGDERPPAFRVKVQFIQMGEKTKMEMRMLLPTPEEAEKTRALIKAAGGNSTWDRLAEYLDENLHGKRRFVINRTFDAPIDVMYSMWTDPKHLAQWSGPTGSSIEYIDVDVKPNGRCFYVMTTADGQKMYGKVHYHELVKPTLIVYAQQFSDENKNTLRHPMAPTWPETMLTRIELSEEGPEQTRVTITWEPHGETTSTEWTTFISARSGMTQGWTGSFDKLDAYLEEMSAAA